LITKAASCSGSGFFIDDTSKLSGPISKIIVTEFL